LKQKYSIIIIPPEHNKSPRQIQFSIKTKKLVVAAFTVFGIGLSGLFIHDLYQSHYIDIYSSKIAQVDKLEKELEGKNLEIARLNDKTAEINSDLIEISSMEQRINDILQISRPDNVSTEISRGGFKLQSVPTAQNLDQARTLLDNYKENMETYYDASVEYEKKLNCTPSIMPVEGEISSDFGYRKNPFGRWTSEFHSGIDIACDYGTPVMATADGTVTFAGLDGYWGRRVEVSHGYGIVTFYAHNSKIDVSVGDNVKKGQVIAYSGNSGRSTGSHLHYTVYVDGELINPLDYTPYNKEQ